MNRSRSKSKQERKEKERQSSQRRSKTPRSRSRPVSPTRDRVLGCVLVSWLALLQMLTRCRCTLPLTLLCPQISAIPGGSKIFYNGLLITVACRGKRANLRGSTCMWACIFTLLHRSILSIIFGVWRHAV